MLSPRPRPSSNEWRDIPRANSPCRANGSPAEYQREPVSQPSRRRCHPSRDGCPAPLPVINGGRLQRWPPGAPHLPGNILAGNGSDDILQIALAATAGQATSRPCPIRPTRSTRARGACGRPADPCAVEPGWRPPAAALLSARARAIFRENPNSPSGTSVAVEDRGAGEEPKRSCWWTKRTRTFGRRQPPEVCPHDNRTSSSRARSARATASPACGLATQSAIRRRAGWPRSKTLQLRRHCHRRRVCRARGCRIRPRELAGRSSRTRAALLGARATPVRGHRSQANFLLVTTPDAAPAGGSTPPSRHAGCSSGFSTRRHWTPCCASASALPRRTMPCSPHLMPPSRESRCGQVRRRRRDRPLPARSRSRGSSPRAAELRRSSC